MSFFSQHALHKEVKISKTLALSNNAFHNSGGTPSVPAVRLIPRCLTACLVSSTLIWPTSTGNSARLSAGCGSGPSS
eukprot:5118990-Pyramimonas_sp.AAC.1